jgi:hypothetical protein
LRDFHFVAETGQSECALNLRGWIFNLQHFANGKHGIFFSRGRNNMADSLNQLLDRLSLDITKQDDKPKSSSPPNDEFVRELNKTKFTIFTPLSDHGYYMWKPPLVTSSSYCRLSDIPDAESIKRHIKLDALPPKLVPLSSLRLPRSFVSLYGAKEFKNTYPYGQYHMASLYVASQCRGVDLNDIDFVFGGSTLEMLAQCDNSDMYKVTKVPGTKKAILIVKPKEYTQNKGDAGFQFERLVTGESMNDASADIAFMEHMHIMKVGSYRVLFLAETDAVSNDAPVEVTASNPYHWGTKRMFQLISNGCPMMCQGVKDRSKQLVQVKHVPLSNLARDALSGASCSQLERKILQGMDALREKMADSEKGEEFRIQFSHNGSLHLESRSKQDGTVLLPPTEIVKELLTKE